VSTTRQPPRQPARPQRPGSRPTPRTGTRSTARQPAAPSARQAPTRRAPNRRPPARPRRRLLSLADPRRRLRAALLTAAVVGSLFVGRLVDLQAIQAPAYAAEAEAGRLRTVDLPAVRGDITDVHGVVLATSVEAWDITTDQTLVTDPAGEAGQLAPLVGIDAATLQTRLTGTKRFAYVARQVTPQVWDQIKALGLPGIFSEQTSRRDYPAGDLASSVIGFVGQDGSGLGGLELGWQPQLAGKSGVHIFEAGAGGREIPSASSEETDPVPGVDVRLTIDRDIQWEAQQALAAEVQAAKADSGTVVVMDPRTGAILALATVPSFDPSDPGAAAPADRGNRALSDVYEPGSTSKIMTMSAVIQEGKLTPNSTIVVPSSLTRGGRTFHDDVPHGQWKLTLTGVLARSSNMGTMLAAETIGPNTLYSYLKKFGIGDPTGLNFPGESPGLLSPPSSWSTAQFETIAFGQGLAVNAVQAASVYATIANNGVRVEPSLVAGTTGANGVFTPAPAPTKTRVVSATTATEVRQMLESVVSDEGTAPMARIPGYRVAGKTGTANRIDSSCGCYRGYTASFIGFAPADAPRLVVAVTLQNPKNGHFGGRLAGPVFKAVMSFALQTLQIPPTGTTPPRLRITAP
jgi:cell division protein FtsI (penicillin-binding protein 3)